MAERKKEIDISAGQLLAEYSAFLIAINKVTQLPEYPEIKNDALVAKFIKWLKSVKPKEANKKLKRLFFLECFKNSDFKKAFGSLINKTISNSSIDLFADLDPKKRGPRPPPHAMGKVWDVEHSNYYGGGRKSRQRGGSPTMVTAAAGRLVVGFGGALLGASMMWFGSEKFDRDSKRIVENLKDVAGELGIDVNKIAREILRRVKSGEPPISTLCQIQPQYQGDYVSPWAVAEHVPVISSYTYVDDPHAPRPAVGGTAADPVPLAEPSAELVVVNPPRGGITGVERDGESRAVAAVPAAASQEHPQGGHNPALCLELIGEGDGEEEEEVSVTVEEWADIIQNHPAEFFAALQNAAKVKMMDDVAKAADFAQISDPRDMTWFDRISSSLNIWYNPRAEGSHAVEKLGGWYAKMGADMQIKRARLTLKLADLIIPRWGMCTGCWRTPRLTCGDRESLLVLQLY